MDFLVCWKAIQEEALQEQAPQSVSGFPSAVPAPRPSKPLRYSSLHVFQVCLPTYWMHAQTTC
ncbi:hypothetical protein DPMN_137882 [Dreissena polymorpha]|uniref:Uncharacterized protein n=1 Tax=Dreissena polymorpha TaxID=45954 RepID=A0A9D4JF36_DREPO|nr:hypothetical protein DPMN_137882 [Dreissena polymorpha]